MALLDYVTVDEAEGAAKETLQKFMDRSDGERILIYEILAHNPHVVETRFEYFTSMMMEGEVDRKTKELIYVTVSDANKCEYCVGGHGRSLIEQVGDPDSEIVDWVVDGELENLTDAERAVVEFARQCTVDPKRVSEEHVEALRDAGYSDSEMVEMLWVAASAKAANTIVDAMNVHRSDVGLEDPIEYTPEPEP